LPTGDKTNNKKEGELRSAMGKDNGHDPEDPILYEIAAIQGKKKPGPGLICVEQIGGWAVSLCCKGKKEGEKKEFRRANITIFLWGTLMQAIGSRRKKKRRGRETWM